MVKDLRRAFAQGEPTPEGLIAIESVHLIEEAIRSGLKLHAVFFSESAEGRADKLLPQLGTHVETVLLPDEVFASVVATENPQGVAALALPKKFKLEDILRAPAPLLLMAIGVQDPGNLGTMLRSAEAFDARGVLLCEGTVKALNAKAMRASAGSWFRLPTVTMKFRDALPQLRAHGVRIVATSSHKGRPLASANLNGAVAVVIGNEGAGLPREVVSEADEIITIPHAPRVESLNAGVAASVILYEAGRQRNSIASRRGDAEA